MESKGHGKSKDLTSLSLDKLIGNLKVHEMIIKKFFKRRGRFSDSGEEDDEKVNNETCLVAQASSEICLGVDLEPDEWIKDSGCSKHMMGNRKLFSSYKAYNGGNVIFGSNIRGNIIGKCTISNESVKIDDVEHVDNLRFNMLSIGQICDNKCRVTFSEHDSEITKDGNVIGRGIRKNGLYVMKLGNEPKDKKFLATIDENSTLWHRRLGHANMCLIQSLASKKLFRNLPKLKFDQHSCDACKIGKQAHASHKSKNIVSTTRCLELLHMDLFGPSAIRSYEGNRYTLVIVDDYSRLVAQGYNQQEGIDYDETYAPVTRLESIRILLAYAYALDFKLFQMDVKSAFLNGFINEEVYVAQPPGFIDFEKPDHVYKLKKALYGLKQAPKAWYDRLKAFLIKHEYKMGMVDNTLFTKKKSSNLIIVQIYVDDIIFGSTCQDMCDEFAKIMHDEFEMSMMGELNFFLGLQIKQMEDGIFFNQSKYIKEMLKKFGLEDSKPMKTPMSSDTKLTKDEEYESVDSTKYRGMIEIMWIERALAVTSRTPTCGHLTTFDELAYGVHTDGPYQTNPLSPYDIISSIRIDREGQVRHIRHEEEIDILEYQVLTRKIEPTLKPLEEIIQENVFCIGGNRDHVPACLCYMLYCVVHFKKLNLAYFMAKRIEWVTKEKRLILPYGMLLTRLFKVIMNENRILYNKSYVLYDRVRNPLATQQERKPIKDCGTRRGHHSTSSSSAFDQPSSSYLNDDDDYGNGEETLCASTPSSIRYVNLLTNQVINSPCYHNKELASPEQTATVLHGSSPFLGANGLTSPRVNGYLYKVPTGSTQFLLVVKFSLPGLLESSGLMDTSGICTFVGCCLTSWFSKKQPALAISTIEAGYVSTGKACQQALWMKQALIDYDVRLDDVPIMCDNKGAIDLSKNPVQHSRTTHIEIRHHVLRDNVQKRHILIKKVSSFDNIADILTKPL
ncbi:retrovirus-related pol polyprotein from transposon TNT 1-94 [Tanacetum coccineum]